jgi:hypothetical protein
MKPVYTKSMKSSTGSSRILKREHEEKWVALNKDRNKVMGFSELLSDLRKKMGEDNTEVVYMKVPRSDTVYAF